MKGYKYRIYPNKQQQQKMMQFFGCCRVVYNLCLDWYTNEYKRWKEQGGNFGKLPLVTAFKKEKEFLKDCDNAALAYARMNFETAIKNMRDSKKGKRKGKKCDFPKRKKRGKCKFIYRTQDSHGAIRFDEENKHIRLPKIGWVKCVKHREFYGRILSVSVSMTSAGHFYVSVLSDEHDLPVINKRRNASSPKTVGLDMSLPHFCVSSDGEDDDMISKYHRFYREEQRKLARLQRMVSRKMKGSNNRNKARIRFAKAYERTHNRRMDFTVKMALYFARKYDAVIIEDINMQSMSRTLHLGKSVMDLGWGGFVKWLEVECRRYDTHLQKADKWFASSKTCNHCGYVNKYLMLKDRDWVCPVCGMHHDRDRNAANNLRDYFLNQYNTVGTTEFQACGDMASTLRETVEQVLSLKQEAAPFREG